MYRELLEFWFSEEVSPFWFNSNTDFDQRLRDTYESTWQKAANGEYDDWRECADGCLALVILLDQLPLNMFRGTAKSFSTEAQSRDVARHAIAEGYDLGMTDQYRSFLYMPFMHSENMDDQAMSVKLFSHPGMEDNLRFARHHYAIVEKFGRFPHRNEALGRQSSEAEIEYLNSKEAFKG